MKYPVLFTTIAFLSACAAVTPIPPGIKLAVAQKPIEELPIYASIEQQRCAKARFSSYQKKRECTHAVRRELAARDMMKN